MQAIARALEDAGIVFIPANGGGQGVRLREPDRETEADDDQQSADKATLAESKPS